MITHRTARKIQMPFVSSGGRSIFSLSSHSLSSTIHRSTAAAAISRTFSQDHSFHESHNDVFGRNSFGVMIAAAASAAAGISLLGVSSSSLRTICDGTGDVNADGQENSKYIVGDDREPEIDPYDNLPEEDEPTHCSICLTYRKGPCRPYWRKVEACTKDGEKEKKEKEDFAVGEDNGEKTDDESMSESTRCFKYMMPWIDCASRYRNLYTLIEMYTNYTEGIEELEATSRHFCWVPGQEPKIDWSNWEQSSVEDADNEAAKVRNKTDRDSTTQDDSSVPLWQTIDPALGDPKLISIEATVPTTINSGLGILECAYAVDQDNNVIGFAYGTKPSDLITNEKSDDGNNDSNEKESKESENQVVGAETDTTDENAYDEKKVTLSVRLLESRTESFVLSASYTHRIEGLTSSDDKQIALESHLYKSKPFVLANIPKNPTPASSS